MRWSQKIENRFTENTKHLGLIRAGNKNTLTCPFAYLCGLHVEFAMSVASHHDEVCVIQYSISDAFQGEHNQKSASMPTRPRARGEQCP